MQIDKQALLDMIRERGGDHDAAQRELPDLVDTDQHGDVLGKFGVNPQELLGKPQELLGRLAGGLGGKLGL